MMKVSSMVAILTILLSGVLLLVQNTAEGFVFVTPPPTTKMTTDLALHPDQGKELEACALELTKNYCIQKNARHHRSKGSPISVIRRFWGAGDHHRQMTTTTTTTATTLPKSSQLSRKKP